MTSETFPKRPLTWLITGSSSGFGLALTRLALANGHKVIATSRVPARTPDLVAEVVAKGGEWVRLDQDDPDCGDVIADLEARGVALDVLANVAATSMTGPAEAFSEDEVRRVMETNFFGPYRLMRAAAPHMRRRRSGVIVNFSSGAGMEAALSLGVYGASKSALDGITKVFHKEMKDFNVRVLLVYLGSFNTAMVGKTEKIAKPLDPDYEGTTTAQYMDVLSTGNFVVNGDHVKATQAIYDVVVGEGIGKGKENEIMIPLGIDMAKRVDECRERLVHAMDVFGEICNDVRVDGAPTGVWQGGFVRKSG